MLWIYPAGRAEGMVECRFRVGVDGASKEWVAKRPNRAVSHRTIGREQENSVISWCRLSLKSTRRFPHMVWSVDGAARIEEKSVKILAEANEGFSFSHIRWNLLQSMSILRHDLPVLPL